MHVMELLTDIPRYAANNFGEKHAVIENNQGVSFVDIDRRSDALASWLIDNGLAAGDRVVLYGENGIAWVVSYYGVLKAGGIVVPVNKLLAAAEVEFIVEHCDAIRILGSQQCLAKLHQSGVLSGVPQLAWDSVDSLFSRIVKHVSARVDTSSKPDDIAAISYTSGTTGQPKGASLTHRNIMTNVTLTAAMHAKSADDVIFSALPCPHVYGNVVFQSIFVTGATLVLFPTFDAVQALDAIEEHKVTVFEGVPTMYYYLLDQALESRDLSSLRMMTVGGQSMPAARMEEARKRFGAPLLELWGMTELAGLGMTHTALSGALSTAPIGSIGITMPGIEARIDSLSQPYGQANAGDEGELKIRGSIVMHSYWCDETATREAIDEEGWLSTGDIATKDAAGFIYIVDRKKDMILTAGYNIYPAEVEAVIASHNAVSMVAVVGLPDDTKGEVPVAFIVVKPGASLTEDSILSYCRERLGAYKVPRRVQFTNELPKTSSGKILRRALRDRNEVTKGET